jgi:hypothetical protein
VNFSAEPLTNRDGRCEIIVWVRNERGSWVGSGVLESICGIASESLSVVDDERT